MYDNPANRPGMSRQAGPFGDTFHSASSGFIRSGLGAYGEKFFGSSSEFMQSSISRYFSDPQYYFRVNDQYVRNKLKVVLCPFLHRGHWTRITEPVGGRLSFKPPIYDIHAPDLYVPFMAFGSFVILAGFSIGFKGKFSPEALTMQFTRGLIGWALQIGLLKGVVYWLGGSEVPLLDLAAYGGYAFAGISSAALVRLVWNRVYYLIMAWTSLCMGAFLVKTMKRAVFAEMRSYEKRPGRGQHYVLLFMAIAQLPLFFWLGDVRAS